MNRWVYTIIFYLALPLILLRLLWRSIKAPAYRLRWSERLGFYKQNKDKRLGKSIVFHAVSVGEVHAAVPLVRFIQEEFPERNIVLTTSTPTGSARVKAIFGDSIEHVYLPYDLPGAVKRFLNFANGDLLIILETELWPNVIHNCDQRGIKVILANARLSEKSLRSYQKIPTLVNLMLRGLSKVAAQSSEDGEAFITLGLERSKLEITGSLKFDIRPDIQQISAGQLLKETFGPRPVLIAGSTREGEEEKVLEAFQNILKSRPEALLILVPRHPERFNVVYSLIKNMGLEIIRRTDKLKVSPNVQVLLGDSMGEMELYYSAADVAFVGGSLVDTGCQSIIEPAALGLPVITGPSLFNFKAVSQVLLKAGGMRVVENPEDLGRAVLELFDNNSARETMSHNALSVIEKSQGATNKMAILIRALMAPKD